MVTLICGVDGHSIITRNGVGSMRKGIMQYGILLVILYEVVKEQIFRCSTITKTYLLEVFI
ncbi:MAG TPA: hypothetical protein DIW17_13240 [Clostridiales bacterium]|nr:hypothetical protein [Clostridiales bacterium]